MNNTKNQNIGSQDTGSKESMPGKKDQQGQQAGQGSQQGTKPAQGGQSGQHTRQSKPGSL